MRLLNRLAGLSKHSGDGASSTRLCLGGSCSSSPPGLFKFLVLLFFGIFALRKRWAISMEKTRTTQVFGIISNVIIRYYLQYDRVLLTTEEMAPQRGQKRSFNFEDCLFGDCQLRWLRGQVRCTENPKNCRGQTEQNPRVVGKNLWTRATSSACAHDEKRRRRDFAHARSPSTSAGWYELTTFVICCQCMYL